MAGPTFGTRVEGLDRLRRAIDRRSVDYQKALAGALFEEAEKTIAEAKRETPVDEGNLRASGHVQLPVISQAEGGGVEVSVTAGFGGPAGAGGNKDQVGYAVYVHEDLDARHTVGKAKYLEDPVNRRRAGVPGRIARGMRRRMV